MSNRQARLSHARVAVVSGNDCLLSNPFVIVPVTRFPLKSVANLPEVESSSR